MVSLIIKYLPSVVIPTIITMIITVIYGNHMLPATFGEYNLFTTTVSLLNATIFTAINSSLFRFFYSYKKENKVYQLFSTYFLVNITFLLCMLIVGFILIGNKIFIIVGCVAGLTFSTLYTNALRAEENIKWFNILKSANPLLTLIILLINISYGNIDMGIAIMALYAPLMIVSIIITFINYKKNNLRIYYNHKIFKDSMKYGIPLAITGFLNIFVSSSDRFMIAYFLDNEQVGLYSFAYKIAELSLVNVTMIIMMALFPQAIKMYESKGREAAEKLISKYINFHFLTTIPVIILIYIYIYILMNIFFPEFAPGANIVRYTMIGTFFFGLSFYTGKAFELTKNTLLMLKALAITAILNVMLNIILIPTLGTIGAVYATICSYLAYVVISVYLSREKFKIVFDYKTIFRILLANLVPTGVIIFMPISSSIGIIKVITGGIIYILIYAVILYGMIKKKWLVI